MKWLIIGTGGISGVFINALKRVGEEPFAVLSRNLDKAQKFSKANKIELYFDKLNDALDVVDAVYVATPNAHHYTYAKRAILKGKHVLIEKVMTDSYKKTKELFDLGISNSVKVMEGYAHITHPEYVSLKVEDGTFLEGDFMAYSSKLKNGTAKNASIFKKETFGGAIPDIGVYPLSFFISKLGPIKNIKISKKKYFMNVLAECLIECVHEKGKSKTMISKLKDGDHYIYIDGKKWKYTSSGRFLENRMDNEIKLFLTKDYDMFNNVSLEVARAIDEVKDDLFI